MCFLYETPLYQSKHHIHHVGILKFWWIKTSLFKEGKELTCLLNFIVHYSLDAFFCSLWNGDLCNLYSIKTTKGEVGIGKSSNMVALDFLRNGQSVSKLIIAMKISMCSVVKVAKPFQCFGKGLDFSVSFGK